MEVWENWLAAYAYYNYWAFESDLFVKHSLPVCVFKSVLRGVGKSDLANLALSIFPSHGLPIKAEELTSDFNAELELKLLFVSEAHKLGLTQLGIIKFVGGEQWILINQKNLAKYLVENNLSLIFSSNDEVPLFTKFIEKDQLTENHNQFFVWEFNKLEKYVKCPELYDDMFDRVGKAFPHYVDTYLKDIWENRVLPNLKGKRYIIPVPVTEYELHMFDSNKTKDDHILENIVFTLGMKKKEIYVTKDMLQYLESENKKEANHIINLLVTKKLIESDMKPRTIDGKTERVYPVNRDVLNKYMKQFKFDFTNQTNTFPFDLT